LRTISTSACVAERAGDRDGEVARQPRQHEGKRHHGERDQQAEARRRGGFVEEYKAKYTKVRDRKERVIIDGICNSACTLVLGIVPLNRICVTPRASLGFHQAYYDKRWTAGLRVTSVAGTDELMSYYPSPVKAWIAKKGGLTAQMKRVFNGTELWGLIDPCPDEH
jgi:hypothetical protein